MSDVSRTETAQPEPLDAQRGNTGAGDVSENSTAGPSGGGDYDPQAGTGAGVGPAEPGYSRGGRGPDGTPRTGSAPTEYPDGTTVAPGSVGTDDRGGGAAAAGATPADYPHGMTAAGSAPADYPHGRTAPGSAPADYPHGRTAPGSAPADYPDATPAGASAPMAESAPNSGASAATEQPGQSPMETQHSLVTEAAALRSRWESVQVSFVDDPRQAVSDAEALVSDVIDDMTAGFRQQRQQLESLWNQGHQVSTEQLRQAIQRYRDFFERFLRV